MWDLNSPNEGSNLGSVRQQSALLRQCELPNTACSVQSEANSIARGAASPAVPNDTIHMHGSRKRKGSQNSAIEAERGFRRWHSSLFVWPH